jgi:very-short-patch-repair endonuclease
MHCTDIPSNPKLIKHARYLRQNMTLGEVLLWHQIRRKQILNTDFNRQIPLLNYIVDFYNIELKLAIEIDGSTHNEKIEKDKIKDQELKKYGVTVFRILESEVRYNMEEVLKALKNKIIGLRSKKIE